MSVGTSSCGSSYTEGTQYSGQFSVDGSVCSDYTVATQYSTGGHPHEMLHNLVPNPLPCELFAVGCDVTFSFSEVDAWIEHVITAHLRDKLPSKVLCWFCDQWDYDCRSPGMGGDRRYNFDCRMRHIYDHFVDGQTAHKMRPDFYMIEHLGRHGLVSQNTYNLLRKWHDIPCSIEEIRHVQRRGFVPPRRLEQQRHSEKIIIDDEKDHRQWKKAQKEKGNRDKPSHHSKR
ncbi:hypothetical protein F4774DRAFT_46291 [Daldinia eschscholtzii]|nr:hypothetical protein F4774DRAFT_46291 [Daldinia eschscholtzii]